MIRHFLITGAAASALLLSACQTTQPLVVTKIQYVPLKISDDLLDLNSCQWPKAPPGAKETDVSNYLTNGYKAWTCENDTRAAIKTQAGRQAQEALDRNSGKAVPTVSVAPTPVASSPKKSWFHLPEIKLNKAS